MRIKIQLLLIFVLIFSLQVFSQGNDSLINTSDIRIRDPFIYADENTKLYYMYVSVEIRTFNDKSNIKTKGCRSIYQ